MVISRRLALGAVLSSALIASSFAADITYNPVNGTYWVTDLSRLKTQIQLQKEFQAAEIAALARKAFKWRTAAAQVAIGAIGLYLIDKYHNVHLDDNGIVKGTPVSNVKEPIPSGAPFDACRVIPLGDYVQYQPQGATQPIYYTLQYPGNQQSGYVEKFRCYNHPERNGAYPTVYASNRPPKYAPVFIPPSEYEPAISPQLWSDLANSVPDTDSAWSPIVDAVQASDTRSDTDGDGWSDADDQWPTMAQYNPDNPANSSSPVTSSGSSTTTTTTTNPANSSSPVTSSGTSTTTTTTTNPANSSSPVTSSGTSTTTTTTTNPANSSSPVTSSGTSTTTTTTTNTTTVTNSYNTVTTTTNTETTVVETSISMEWPAFCSWAGIVCSAIDWMRSRPVEPDVPDFPHQEIDVGTLTQDFDSGLGGGSCPSPVSVAFMGQTVTFSYDSACWAASSVFRPILLASAFLITGFILMGRGDLT